jgi:hypothetical protein
MAIEASQPFGCSEQKRLTLYLSIMPRRIAMIGVYKATERHA